MEYEMPSPDIKRSENTVRVIGANEPLSITRIFQQRGNAHTLCRTKCALLPMPCLEESLPCLRDYGWYWNETEELRFLAEELHRRRIELDVWGTPQMSAIEWLLDCQPLKLPPYFDSAVHGVFHRVISLKILAENEALESDLVSALEAISVASELRIKAADKLSAVSSQVLDLMRRAPPAFSLSADQVNFVSCAAAEQLGAMKGFVQAELRHRREASTRLLGPDANKALGAKRRWLSDVATLYAADIFLTAGFPRERTRKGGKSFQAFLHRFCQGIPNVETADKAALARKFWDGEGGSVFAPPENALSRMRGKIPSSG